MKSSTLVLILSVALLTLSGCESDPIPTAGSASIERPLQQKPVPPATFKN